MELFLNLEFADLPAFYIGHLILFSLTVGSVSLALQVYKRLGIGKAIEQRPLRQNQVSQEVRWGLSTQLVMSVYVLLSLSFIDSLTPDSLFIAAMNLLIFFAAHDLYVYLTHRLLHTKFFWRFHRQHHKAVRATPWSSLNMHPVEALVNYFPFFVFAALAPVSLAVFLGVYVYLLFGIVYSHSNYNVSQKSRSKLVKSLNEFHQHHHSSPNGNFGLLHTHWDSAFGTRLPERP